MNTIHVIGPSIYFMYVRSFQELWYPSRTGLSPGESDWPKIVQLVGARPVWLWISCSLQLPWPDCLPWLLLGGARPVLPTGSGGEGSAWPGKQTKRPPGGCPVLPPHKPLRDSHSPGSLPTPLYSISVSSVQFLNAVLFLLTKVRVTVSSREIFKVFSFLKNMPFLKMIIKKF